MNIRNSLLAAAALAISVPVHAADLPDSARFEEPATPAGLIFSGIVEGAVGYSWLTDDTNNEFSDTEYPFLTGGAYVNIPLGMNFSAQLDMNAEGYFSDEGQDSEAQRSIVSGGAHLNWRDPNIGLLGVFGGVGLGSLTDDDSSQAYWLGIEGQYYWNNLTLYAQAAFFNGEIPDHSSSVDFEDAYIVRGVARYFIDPDFRIEGEASYAAEGNIHGDDYDSLAWGLRADKRISNHPIYGFVAYRGALHDADNPSEGAVTVHDLMVGLKFAFGGNSLLDQDRYGVTLDQPLNGLRATNYITPLD